MVTKNDGLAKRPDLHRSQLKIPPEFVGDDPSLGFVEARRHGRRCHGIKRDIELEILGEMLRVLLEPATEAYKSRGRSH